MKLFLIKQKTTNILCVEQSDSAVNRLSANSAGLIAVPYDNR